MADTKIKTVDCCGCSACASACPVKAVKMGFNDKGGYTPVVDDQLCVGCGLCEKVCTVLNESTGEGIRPLDEERCYIAVAKDRSVLSKSSSGGVGHIFAKEALRQGRMVCGVTYDTERECAKHIMLESESELERIQGSKYLQSACGEAFRSVVEWKGEGIVFGTPCQIAGLDAVLRRKKCRDRFVLVDIFCHGVPSQLLWDNHVKWLREHKGVPRHTDAVFRQGKDFRLKKGDNYSAWYNEDAFFTFFLRGWLKNHRCHECHLRRKSCADIRIGDCMAEKYAVLSYSPSCVIVNTEQGERFLKSCQDELECYPERFSVIDGIQERDNVPVPVNHEAYLKSLAEGTAPEELIKKVMVTGRVKSLIKNRLLRKKGVEKPGDLKRAVESDR